MATPPSAGSKRRSLGLSRKWLPGKSSPLMKPVASPRNMKATTVIRAGPIVDSTSSSGPSPRLHSPPPFACQEVTSNRADESSAASARPMPRTTQLRVTCANATTQDRLTMPHSTKKRRFKTTFKSPMKVIEPCSQSEDRLEDEIEKLKKQLQLLNDEEQDLRSHGFVEEELQQHIDKLHEYNELKDTGQMLLGKIASLEGRTTREMYDRFGLDLED